MHRFWNFFTHNPSNKCHKVWNNYRNVENSYCSKKHKITKLTRAIASNSIHDTFNLRNDVWENPCKRDVKRCQQNMFYVSQKEASGLSAIDDLLICYRGDNWDLIVLLFTFDLVHSCTGVIRREGLCSLFTDKDIYERVLFRTSINLFIIILCDFLCNIR